MIDETDGGRIFFSSAGRSLESEDQIRLVSVGVDIGSSTSHLVFSQLALQLRYNRYVLSEREIVHESDILLTPYAADLTINAARLGAFIERQYEIAEIDPAAIDTGALILTGVAARRGNARAIGDLFAAQTGKFVAVSAGDALETRLSALGSGAVARSLEANARVMNIDVGGGTTKIAICEHGDIVAMTAIDIGARNFVFGADDRLARIEPAGSRLAAEAGLTLAIGDVIPESARDDLANLMADRLFETMSAPTLSAGTHALLRLDPLPAGRTPDIVTFSGGVSEYIYGRQARSFGDFGPRLARALLARVEAWGPRIEKPQEGIRATVVGASQYTVQASGNTIFVTPAQVLPLRNVPVIAPDLPLDDETLDGVRIADAIRHALRRLDLHEGGQAVALCYRWRGPATWRRLDAFCRAMMEGLAAPLLQGFPLVLVGDGDIGGLVGLHCRDELKCEQAVVSIDGIVLNEFDFIDIGAMLQATGAVPVVIKSLVFPASAAPGRAEAS